MKGHSFYWNESAIYKLDVNYVMIIKETITP